MHYHHVHVHFHYEKLHCGVICYYPEISKHILSVTVFSSLLFIVYFISQMISISIYIYSFVYDVIIHLKLLFWAHK